MKLNIEKLFPLIIVAVISVMLLIFASYGRFRTPGPGAVHGTGYSRIVSLSPSITREIMLLGKEGLLAGITSFCPDTGREIPKVGNLINPNIEKIVELEPDIVLFSEEDNPAMKFEGLLQSRVPMYKFRRNRNFTDISANFIALADILGVKNAGEKIISDYSSSRKKLVTRRSKRIKGAFFLSSEPLISVSGESYINAILTDAGIDNIISKYSNPYPIVSVELLIESKPEIIFSTDTEASVFFDELYAKAGLPVPDVIIMKPDNVCYYTPEDYLKSLEFFSRVLDER